MADNTVAGFGKDPLTTSHGDALADQSFQSLKSKEIRDSLSPTEMKFQSMALNNPNTTGWNVQSSKEISPDGRGFRAETVATTDGVESVNGGIAEFKGHNEQRSSAHHEGDDKNFVKKAMESSNSHLQEKVVIGDENSGRTEVRTSSSKSTSSSQVIQSSSTNVEYDDGYPRQQVQPQKYLMDSNLQQRQQQEQRLLEEQRIYEQQFKQQHQQHLNQQERRVNEQLSTTRQNTEQKNISQNIQTQETHEQNKRYVDMDKASPEYQQHVQYLMQQPGEIISSTVEYPKPNVKMITTVKRLPDGTIVRNKRYETEELPPTTPTTRTTPTATNQTQPKRHSQQQSTKPSQDMVDSSSRPRYVQDTHTDDVETKFSSIKKSSRKFSTETTSETIHEVDDHYTHGEYSPRAKSVKNDFSTHGFPSVRANKPTQEYPTDRPQTARPTTQAYPSQPGPSGATEAVVPNYTDATDNINDRRITNKDGEVIIVSSEKKHNYKTSTNSERIVETEHVIRDDQSYQQITDKNQDFTTQGFTSVSEPNSQQPKNHPNERQIQPYEQDFPLDKLPSDSRIIKNTHSPHDDDGVVVVSSQKSHTAKHITNTERVIEHEIIRDDHQGVYPRIQPNTDNSPYNYTVTTPGEQIPQGEFPGSPRKPNNADYSTQGFPSVRTPGHGTPADREPYGDYPSTSKPSSNDYSTHGFPSVKPSSRPAAGLPSSHNQHLSSPRKSPGQDFSTHGFPSVRSPTKATPTQGYPSNVDGGRPNGTTEQPRTAPTTKTQPRTPSPNMCKAPNTTVRETTERIIRKEKEVDSAHRAFAASLRSSSPIDHVRRDSYTTDSHTRHTPRSSVSSTKTFRRDMREGSHDSAPSETSRISTTTITRNTPPRPMGGRTVVTKVTTKSPSPGKTVTTTTTTRTLTSKDVPKATEPTKKKTSPQPSKNSKMSTTTTDSVAARRSLFESNPSSPSSTPTKRTPLTSPMSGRRPSYMDHTKSSLEHTRRDSLEINKTNYSRKPSHPEDEVAGIDRNSMVKFDVPQGKRATTPRATSTTEDINVEDIFELEVLERLLETVQSYEIRRRIRAQIRLIKKNQKNELISSTTEVSTTKTVKTSKIESEEPDTTITTSKKTKPEIKTTNQTTAKDAGSHVSSTKKEYIFEEAYLPSRRSPKPNRYPYEEEKPVSKSTRSQSPQSPVCRRNAEHERQYERSHHSPEHQHHTELKEEYGSRTTKQQYYYKGEHEHEEVTQENSLSRKTPSPTRKPQSLHSSPERRHVSPESQKPSRTNERSRSPQTKKPQINRATSSRSPDSKTSSTTVRKSSATFEQQETVKESSTKPQTKRITTTTTTTTKSKPEDKAPVWADRKNILKAPGTTTPKKPTTSTVDSRSGFTKTVKSTTTSQKMTTNDKSSFVDDDCVTSSYGIGPTDENGLPLFGIRALKKKKPAVEPSETTEEVTGYVVEEKYYSDSKTKPTVERKEFIYSTNPEELQKLKDQVEVATNRKALKDVEVKETRKTALISKAPLALRSSPEDDFLDSTTKYVRRGSVKEMSEKFIQREASSTLSEKTNNYPKAGLILRTNSRKNSRDADNDNENFESYKTTRVQQYHNTTSSVLADSDEGEHEYEVEEVGSRHSGRFITESESECDSIKTQREFKKVTSSSSSSMATRSFLNTQGEERVITNVTDCLERMRNADNVVEEGDTAEDQEARALLNKFLGASIIMKGVESSLPASSNRQSQIITTTTTGSNLSDDNDGDNNAKHEVKTTRITKTIKSGSSSTPVTYTTCDIEEIWDEEILKELLEQARTYEERRKIRSRLRELMADREEQKQQKSSVSTTEKTETKEKDGAVVTTTTKVTTRTVTGSAAKPVSPFAKFKQLDNQNTQQSAKSPTTPTTASPSTGNQPIFKFTDPALNARAATVKEQLLQWCQSKTQEYENIEITNFSTSWNNGLAFCALIHHFLPDAFDYSQLTPKNRRKNFELAFTVADEKAGIAPLLDVEDMVVMQRPDWKCVFVYVQSIYRRFRNCQ